MTKEAFAAVHRTGGTTLPTRAARRAPPRTRASAGASFLNLFRRAVAAPFAKNPTAPAS